MAIAGLLLASCSRQPVVPALQRIAILRFENLGADARKDWMGRAFSEVITKELAGAPGIYAISTGRLQSTGQALGPRPDKAPGISSQRAAAIASGANRLGYGQFSIRDGRLEATLTMEDPAAGKMVQMFATEGKAEDIVHTATALARQVSGSAADYLTTNARAVEGYVSAMEAKDTETAQRHLEEAIAADPNFTPAYRLLAELKARQKDHAGAMSIFAKALTRGEEVRADERAMIEGEMAAMRGDRALAERALLTLVKWNPRDPMVWRNLAETAMARRNYKQASEAFSKALEIEPEDWSAWNQYGYAAAYNGDLATAMTALRRYQALRPAEPNPLDSQGDVNLLHGRFREAEGFYLEAAKKDPNFLNGGDLFKAAMARLMTGDVAGADGLAKQYVAARTAVNDPLAPVREAEWDWAAGRRNEGYRRMEAIAKASESGGQRDLSAHAYTTLAIWSLMLGNREATAETAAKALGLASSSLALPAYIARFLAQPSADANEWALRAERLFPNAPVNSIKELTLAYALLFAKQFQPASILLRQLDASGTTAADMNLQILLAWTLIETGHVKEAETLLRWNPISPPSGTGPFLSLYFPRLYYLRAIAAEKDGRGEEARKHYRLFLQLSGPVPLMWGEEQKAKGKL